MATPPRGLIAKLLDTPLTKLMLGPRMMTAGAAYIGHQQAQTYISGGSSMFGLFNIPGVEETQRAWFGDEIYENHYSKGLEATKTLLTVGAVGVGAGAFIGPPVARMLGKGVAGSIGLAARGVTGGLKMGGMGVLGTLAATSRGLDATSKIIAGTAQSYFYSALSATRYGRKLARLTKAETAMRNEAMRNPWVMSRAEHVRRARNSIELDRTKRRVTSYADKVRRGENIANRGKVEYRLAHRKAMQGLSRMSKFFSARPTMDITKWSGKTRVLAGLSGIGVGLGIGHYGGLVEKHYPSLESANMVFSKPSTNRRMNFSTAGLTQALHSKATRRL